MRALPSLRGIVAEEEKHAGQANTEKEDAEEKQLGETI